MPTLSASLGGAGANNYIPCARNPRVDSKYFALGVLLVAFFAAAGLGVLVYLENMKPAPAQAPLGQKGVVGQQKAILPSQPLPAAGGAQKNAAALPQANLTPPAPNASAAPGSPKSPQPGRNETPAPPR